MASDRMLLSTILQPTAELMEGVERISADAVSATSAAIQLGEEALEPVLQKILDTDLVAVAISGWKKYRALQKFRDRDQYPPDMVATLSLYEHTLSSKHRPRLEILLNGASLTSIEFDFELSLVFDAVTLLVQDARIREISPGQCRAQVELGYAGETLWKQKTDSFEFPGKLSIKSGIPIPSL